MRYIDQNEIHSPADNNNLLPGTLVFEKSKGEYAEGMENSGWSKILIYICRQSESVSNLPSVTESPDIPGQSRSRWKFKEFSNSPSYTGLSWRKNLLKENYNNSNIHFQKIKKSFIRWIHIHYFFGRISIGFWKMLWTQFILISIYLSEIKCNNAQFLCD